MGRGWGTSMVLARIKLSFAYFIYTMHVIRNHTVLHLTYLVRRTSLQDVIQNSKEVTQVIEHIGTARSLPFAWGVVQLVITEWPITYF